MEKINRKKFLKSMGALSTAAAITPSLFAFESATPRSSLLSRKIKVGVIGCGSVARKYIPHLTDSPYAEIVSLCDIIPERSKKYANEFNINNWYPHVDKMIAGVDFDLFVNLTDMQEHGRLNRIAINAGKHVWSEKPMANTYDEGLDLLNLAKSKGLRIWGAPAVVNSPQFAFMAQQVNE